MSGTDQLFTKLAISRSLYNLEPSNGIPGGNLMKAIILLSVTTLETVGFEICVTMIYSSDFIMKSK